MEKKKNNNSGFNKQKFHLVDEYFANPLHPITVILIGIGGTGSHVLTQLGRIHHALVSLGKKGLHVTAYDSDIVDTFNVGRQNFTEADIGLHKSIIAIQRINQFYGTNWKAEVKNFYGEKPANIYISCIDKAHSRVLINDNLLKLKDRLSCTGYIDYPDKMYYLLDIGNDDKSGQIILGEIIQLKNKTKKSLPTITDMYREELLSINDNEKPSCSMRESLLKQDLFINSILAQYAGQILWSLFFDYILFYHGIFINLKSLRTSPVLIP